MANFFSAELEIGGATQSPFSPYVVAGSLAKPPGC